MSNKGGDALGEDASGATRVDTAKAPSMEHEGDGHVADREIGDAALIVAVDAMGTTMAQRARSGATRGSRGERHAVITGSNIIDA